MRLYIVAMILILGCVHLTSHAGTPSECPKLFIQGINHYHEGDYTAAISAFLKIVDTGVENGKLYYNLGNAYLKNDEVGHAILWYERALKMIPNDPDLTFNYEYALSLTKDEKPVKDISLMGIFFFWKQWLSRSAIQWISILLNGFFWLTLILYGFFRKAIIKNISFVVLFFMIIFTGTMIYNYYENQYIRKGIVLPEKVSVRSGFTEDSTELFVLHAGAKVTIQKDSKAYYRIFYSEGKIGWVKQSEIGVI